MNTETQTVVLSELAAVCKAATDLFGDANNVYLKANAIGAVSDTFKPEAFTGTLQGLTPLDALGVFAFLSGLQNLIDTEITVGENKIVLGSALLKFGLASR